MDAYTLDQFAIFIAVVEAGSFSGAARKLNRAQSAITYAMQKLEDHVGAALFDRSTYRPTLSEAGRILLPKAQRIMDDVARFRSSALELSRGLEAQLRVAVAGGVPMNLLTPALADFRDMFPTVQVRLIVQPFSMATGRNAPALAKGTADLRILYEQLLPGTFQRYLISEIELVTVAASSHPLARMTGVLDAQILRDHLQLVLSEVEEAVAGEDVQVAALNTWRVTDQSARHSLILAGIGWGSLPEALVMDDLSSGRLVRLSVRDDGRFQQVRSLHLVVAHRQDEPPGPAGRWLLGRLSGAPPEV
ncbi:LysR family transcriptional regulator [Bosea sp. LjRoot9]|uniref:LysR family transcriptional regulator n=1 Tax=Bosea sp. LjRoot9 TaxID=3342341 RepID=UPI003ECF449F